MSKKIPNFSWCNFNSEHYLSRESPSLYSVYAGDIDLEGNGERHDIAKFVVHEDYDPFNQYINDIALIRVSLIFLFL